MPYHPYMSAEQERIDDLCAEAARILDRWFQLPDWPGSLTWQKNVNHWVGLALDEAAELREQEGRT